MTTKSKRVYVLVDDDQVPLSPADVAAAVSEVGFYRAAERFGFADTTLRAFLAKNGVKARTTIIYEKESAVPTHEEAYATELAVLNAEANLGG